MGGYEVFGSRTLFGYELTSSHVSQLLRDKNYEGRLVMLYVYGACPKCGCSYGECECAERVTLLLAKKI